MRSIVRLRRKKIYELAQSIGLDKDDLIPYGHYMRQAQPECLARGF
ncbi:MAG: hypothetical protein R3C24_02160 [Cyanobacteriota/Melainabacteria group bacterium]